MLQMSAPPAVASRGRVLECDAFRGIASILVILQHTLPATTFFGSFLISPLPSFLGMRTFFMLSGYLITGILLDAQCRNPSVWSVLKAFHIRRLLRIFPLYYVVLTLCFLGGVTATREGWVAYYTYTENFRFSNLNAYEFPFGHFWSLAVEEQFYLVWPIVLLTTPRRLLPWLLASFLGVGAISRYLLLREWNVVAAYTLMPARIDAFAIGALLAWLQRTPESEVPRLIRVWRRTWVWSGAMLLLVPYIWRYVDWGLVHGGMFRLTPHGADILGDTGYALLCTSFLSSMLRGLPKTLDAVFRWNPFVYLGQISYCTYMIHPIVMAIGWKFGPPWFPAQQSLALALVVLPITIAVASLSWWVFEKPLNDLRRFFPYAPDATRPSMPVPAARETVVTV